MRKTRARLAGTLDRVRVRLSKRTDLDRELAAAAVTQAQLLPRGLPHITGYECAAVTIPARVVGGDFYLAQPVGQSRYSLALGDVAGKGIPAGLVASSLQARLETVARQGTWTAAQIITDINRTLCDTIGSDRFATLVYLELDADTNLATVVNAGHPAVIIIREDGRRELVVSTGPALGVIPDATFESQTIALTAGSTLVVYSDGVIEAVDDVDDELGEARVAAEIQLHMRDGAETLCLRLLDVVRAHRGGAPSADDATVMVIKRT